MTNFKDFIQQNQLSNAEVLPVKVTIGGQPGAFMGFACSHKDFRFNLVSLQFKTKHMRSIQVVCVCVCVRPMTDYNTSLAYSYFQLLKYLQNPSGLENGYYFYPLI